MTDPLHQFEIHVIAPLFSIFGVQFNFTNAALFMLVIVAIICALLYAAFANPELVPSRRDQVRHDAREAEGRERAARWGTSEGPHRAEE